MIAAVAPLPWIAWIGVKGSVHGSTAAVVNDHEKSAAIPSGGSSASWSVTAAARIVTVHVAPTRKFATGLMVNVVGPPLTSASTAPPPAQVTANHGPVTFTGSEKVTLRFASSATSVAPFAGVVDITTGAASGMNVVFGPPGVLTASPGTSVPKKPGMPARSKSLRTQSAAVSVSIPSGIRDAPPGAKAAPS